MIIEAPAKIILFGEHAVVYGMPAIAAPVHSLYASATIMPDDKVSIVLGGETISLDPVNNHPLVKMALLVQDHFKATLSNTSIHLKSAIPVASGLGSGAALSTVVGRAVSAALGYQLSKEALNAMVYEIEKIYHGTPSGIDNTVIVYEETVYFVRDKGIQKLKVPHAFDIIIADTGDYSPTHIPVTDVRRMVEEQPEQMAPVLDAIQALTISARQHIESGNIQALGPLMTENHRHLQTLTVSSERLDMLVNSALDAGAWGAKLSGGGRGGNMIALAAPADTERICQSLKDVGAIRTVVTTIGVHE